MGSKRQSELLEETLEVFEGGEWWSQGEYFDYWWDQESDEIKEKAKMCMAGGLMLAVTGTQDTLVYRIEALPCTTTLANVIKDLYHDRVYQCESDPLANITTFNDHKDTTFEDVQLVFKHAIQKELKNEE